MSSQGHQPQFLTADEVSARYDGKISTRTLANWRNLGNGPPFSKIGGKILYRLADLVAWEEKRTVQSTSEYRKAS